MVSGPFVALAFAGAALALSFSAGVHARPIGSAAAAPAPASGGSGDWSALSRIDGAASLQNFRGTFVISSGGNVASARMVHFCLGPEQFESIESMDGRARNVFRHNDEVHTIWPASKVAVVERRDVLNSFPALLQAGGAGIARSYAIEPAGEERVAGHEADLLIVRPRDAYRYGYRLWSEKRSGLLLRADVIGAEGQVLETAAFSEVTIGVRPQPAEMLRTMESLDGYRVLRPVRHPTRLEDEGWVMREVAPGFREVSCVNREMDNPGDVEASGSPQRVLQAIYADGMTYVSVFVEPYRSEQHHGRSLQTSVGATHTLSMRRGDWWVTVVGDTPPATLRIFATGLERRQ